MFAGEIVLLCLILHIFDIHDDQYHVIGASRCDIVGNLHSSNFCTTSCVGRVRGVKVGGRKEKWREGGREGGREEEGGGRGRGQGGGGRGRTKREGGNYNGDPGIH